MTADIGSPSGETEALRQQVEALKQQVAELDLRVARRDLKLTAERERSDRGRRKVRQLLAKLAERDAALDELRAMLKQVQAFHSAATSMRQKAASQDQRKERRASAPGDSSVSGTAASGRRRAGAGAGKDRSRGQRGAVSAREAAIHERADIVVQLERHLAQMRSNLIESEKEVLELEARKREKEAEWGKGPEEMSHSSTATVRVHWQRLGMIGQQLQEKREFASELHQKTKGLEEQLKQQTAFLEELRRSKIQSASPESASPERGNPNASLGDVPDDDEDDDEDGLDDEEDDDGEEDDLEDDVAEPMPGGAGDLSLNSTGNEAMEAFLSAAGDAADMIYERSALRAAFESQPPILSDSAMDGLEAEERAQALSLFAAWVAVSTEPRALRLSDLALQLTDAVELHNTLETCGAQLEEWEMTRCPAKEGTLRALLHGLASQPLQQLSLGYNALGPAGVNALSAAASAWSGTLQHLGLEMNGLGDGGCSEVAKILSAGVLPHLRILELGWNELSAACAPALAGLLTHRGASSEGGASGPLSRIVKVGLGGNKLGSDGARTLVLAALACPTQRLELDLSMNHVGAPPLLVLAEWVETKAVAPVLVTICLEWNVIDDVAAVNRLAASVCARGLAQGVAAVPFVRLANNDDLADLDPAEVLARSKGLVSC